MEPGPVTRHVRPESMLCGATLGAMTTRTRTASGIVIGLCLVFVIAGTVLLAPRSSASEDTNPAAPPSPSASPVPNPSQGSPSQVGMPGVPVGTTLATTLLATLPVKPALTMAGYNRTGEFGTAWLDEDRNGCDTRNDILRRDLTGATRSGICKILTGLLVSPYTGQTIHFVRGEKTSSLVQIDHLVALADAWETGAQSLTQQQRLRLANDPLELMAVDGRSNDQKSDKDASEWLPSNASFDCVYVARQISVKVTYSLWVTRAEHDAMAKVLLHCGAITGTASSFAG
ncbi:MAG: hypothetical protein QOD50_1432 [Actinomycetota bacterium]|nr:hypothetical protein [Actinomycetota bacterium]